MITCELWVRPSIESSAGLRIASEGDAFGPRTVLVSKKLATCELKHVSLVPSHQVNKVRVRHSIYLEISALFESSSGACKGSL